jgi:hypothetical protein
MSAQARWKRRFIRWFSIYILLSLLSGIVLAELQLHLQRRPLRHRKEVANAVRDQYHGLMEDVQL